MDDTLCIEKEDDKYLLFECGAIDAVCDVGVVSYKVQLTPEETRNLYEVMHEYYKQGE